MKAGRHPILTFSEQVKLRSIQAAFGIGSPEEDAFWEQVRVAAKLRRNIKRGKKTVPQPKKFATYAEAHRAAMKTYYQRHGERIRARQRERYRLKKERLNLFGDDENDKLGRAPGSPDAGRVLSKNES